MRRPGPVSFSLCNYGGADLHECDGRTWHLIYVMEDGAVCEVFHRSKKDALAELAARSVPCS